MNQVINGRPDFDDHSFGKTRVKRHPKYVYGASVTALLIHEIGYVELHWYDADFDRLIRRDSPKTIIVTRCNQIFFVRNHKGTGSTMCEIPKQDAVLCTRCQGASGVFFKSGAVSKDGRITKQEAHKLLGCAVSVEQSDRII